MESVSNGTTGAHDVQVTAQNQRRRFSAAYKMKIVGEADKCSKSGDLGALLRREGLYSSHLATWRRARDQGELVNTPKRGRRPKPVDPNAKLVADLERKLAKATARAERAEALVEVQKKVAALLGKPFLDEES